MLTFTLTILAALVALVPVAGFLMRRIKDPFHPMLWMGTIAFLLVPFRMWRNWNGVLTLLDEGILQRYLLVMIISMLGLYWGWWYWSHQQLKKLMLKPAPEASEYDPSRLIPAVVVMLMISLPIHFLFNNTADVGLSSGYQRDWSLLWLPASILTIQAMQMVRPSSRILLVLLLLVAMVPPIAVTINYGSRGIIFRLAILGSLFFMQKGTRPSVRFMAIGGTAVLLLVGGMTTTRVLIAQGRAANRFDAFVQVIPALMKGELDVYSNEKVDTGEEYVFGPAEVETVRQSGKYGNGLSVTVGVVGRFLPRGYFPNKDEITTFHGGYDPVAIKYASGLKISGGAAPSGFAYGFLELGWACPVLWFVMGFFYRGFWQRSIWSNDLRFKGYLAGFSISMVYAMTQDLLSAEIYFIYVSVPLFFAYKFARLKAAPTGMTLAEGIA